MSLFSKVWRPRQRKILAVDDEPNVLNMLAELLAGAGYQVDTATNGLDGHALIKKNKYDLIVLDSRMPKLPGTELLKFIRAMPGGGQQAVIMLSAEEMADNMEKAFAPGVLEWVTKPFSPERFLKKVSEHISAVK